MRQNGILLLGSAETVGSLTRSFEEISKSARLYRHVGGRRAGDLNFLPQKSDHIRVPPRLQANQEPSRQSAFAELCRQALVENYAPAAVLINRKHDCLYTLGPTDKYLRIASGHASHNLLTMVPQSVRRKMKSALERASRENSRDLTSGIRMTRDGTVISFNLDVLPVENEGELLLLVCFVERAEQQWDESSPRRADRELGSGALEQELRATRTELEEATRNLESSSEEQKAINEEALSVNEEYQSTNEELLTSKEELQSLNEELTALNGQLQETLERQRITSNDLQNVLYSTNVATIFLDNDLNIRFFTPATKLLFNVIAGDVGRPLADLHSLAADTMLPNDARNVLRNFEPIDRDVEVPSGAWFVRRILPYRSHDNSVEGVVITFTDITEQRRTTHALEIAMQQAELATMAKSRFLAAASHDLRQPLQALTLIQGLLNKLIVGETEKNLVKRLDQTLGAMSGMLNSILDINQIEAGTVRPDPVDFNIDGLFVRLRDEFLFQAQSQGLELRVVACSLIVRSDPSLLERMVRNLLSNALKYTRRGRVLLGCRRRGSVLSVEIWDTGIGIPTAELKAIFEEYRQLDNAAQDRSHGLGLGLSIVQRLGQMLGHHIRVQSRRGRGSMFAIEVPLPPRGATPILRPRISPTDAIEHKRGIVMIVEDDPHIRGLVGMFLTEQGHAVEPASDGVAALQLLERGVRPDLVISDYNLPGGSNGLQVIAKIRETLGHEVAAVVLTGDISTATLRDIGTARCQKLNKPVRLDDLNKVIQQLLATSDIQPPGRSQPVHKPIDRPDAPVIFIVDDDGEVRDTLRVVLEEDGRNVEAYSSCEDFLESYVPDRGGCLLLDAYLPGMPGLELLRQLRAKGDRLPAIMITGNSDVLVAVQAMKAGASDFIEKPVGSSELFASIEQALEQTRNADKPLAWQTSATNHIRGLTSRQRQVMEMVLAGCPSKNIAADLGISQRTVENHRASIMKKTGAKSLPALARLALAATWNGLDDPSR